ncbi:MAG: hypothetical protein KAG53_02965 [Endozoicomonadaceae bacterium]|nr:hypothetical protein [Endozoicomonadaceae bacterium]
MFSDKRLTEIIFKWSHGYPLDLSNTRTLNEKLQWLKLYDKKPEYARFVDKYEVRKYIENKIGHEYLIPLLRVFNKNDEINLDGLEYPYIIKPNHANGLYRIIRSDNDLNIKKLRKECSAWLKVNAYKLSREWQYNKIVPKIVVEKLLTNKNETIAFDYKFHCIHGEIIAIQVDLDRQDNHSQAFYDQEWNILPFKWGPYARAINIDRPNCLDKITEKTKLLAQEFSFIRIDWYILDNQFYFGELTLHPYGGFMQFHPESWDMKFGMKLKTESITIT